MQDALAAAIASGPASIRSPTCTRDPRRAVTRGVTGSHQALVPRGTAGAAAALIELALRQLPSLLAGTGRSTRITSTDPLAGLTASSPNWSGMRRRAPIPRFAPGAGRPRSRRSAGRRAGRPTRPGHRATARSRRADNEPSAPVVLFARYAVPLPSRYEAESIVQGRSLNLERKFDA